ncbi:MAG: diaminopimelate epimerase [Flavobacteriia bacterium]|nr:diaminopimelate epimerase [Flavobacteriia bacterium]
MKISFYKYQGAGNDFVMIDDRNLEFPAETEFIQKMCDRHFGIGADGLILLQKDPSADFRMVYYNADGNIGSMCGNGGRCIVRFAEDLGLINDKAEFQASDGLHTAFIEKKIIRLSMRDVEKIEKHLNHWFLDTGSPHHIEFMDDTQKVDVRTKGAEIRYGSPYFEKGSNVNFVQILNEDTIKIRTYERGVEDETFACGTGVTAAAIAAYESGKIAVDNINVKAVGGDLKVSFSKNDDGIYQEIWLSGPAEFEFKGEIEIK